MTDYDQYFARRDRQSASATLFARPDPERAARANRLSRELGLPADTIESDISTYETQQSVRRARQLMESSTALTQWASDDRNAAIAADDMEGAARNADYWRRAATGAIRPTAAPRASIWNVLEGVGANFAAMREGIRQQGDDFLSWLGIGAPQARGRGVPSLGVEVSRQSQMRRTQQSQVRANAAAPEFQSRIAEGAYSGVTSLVQQSPGLLGTVLSGGNPVPALAWAGTTTQTQNYGKYRARGATPLQALAGSAGEGAVEVATELIPMHQLVGAFGKQGAKSFLRGVGASVLSDIPGEQIATLAQDAIDTAVANPDKTWRQYLEERPGAAVSTLFATLTQGAITGGVGFGARAAIQRAGLAGDAQANGAAVDAAMAEAAGSKVRQRDPVAFAALVGLHTDGTPIERLFVPADAVEQYFQSNEVPPEQADFWDRYRDQIEEARATGGDVVIPMSDAAAHLAGTPAWDALRPDVRLSPGGMSMREATAFDEDEGLGVAEAGAAIDAERAAAEPQRRLFEGVTQKLMNAGYTPDVARTNAEILTARATTRATRLGQALTGQELDDLDIVQVLPEKLAPMVAVDQLDVTINAMRRARGGKVTAPSLLDWITRQGGIEDRGGDIAAMGGGAWHRSKPGRRRLIRPHGEQGSMLGATEQQNANTPDELAVRAQEAGYFPAGERPTVNELLDAIGEELRGRPIYAEGPNIDQTREAADELAAMLDQAGIDPSKATNAQIRDVLDRYRRDAGAANGYQQAPSPVRLSGDEVGPAGLATPDLRQRARAWYDSHLKGKTLPSDVLGGDVVFAGSRKAFNSSADPRKLRVFPALPALLNDADYHEARPPRPEKGEKNVKAYHYIEGTVDLGGSPVRVGVTVREDNNGRFYYNHTMQDGAGETQSFDQSTEETASDPQSVRSKAAPVAGGQSNGNIGDRQDGINMVLGNATAPRGRVTFRDGRATIELFERRDLSTLIHEAGHTWLEELRADSLASRNREVFYHGSTNPDLTIENVRILGGDRKQNKPGRNYGGFYVAGVAGMNEAQGYAGADGVTYRVELKPDAVTEVREGDITRLSESTIAEYRERGVDVVKGKDPRGRTEFAIINQDAIERLIDRAAAQDTPGQLIADWETVRQWFASNGHPVAEDGTIPVEAHELWARGIERYVMEGKSPSRALAKVFEAFRSWLLTIYRHVANLNTPITPEIRAVMDRLVATDDEIAAAQDDEHTKALFDDAAAAGMTGPEFAAYRESLETARSEAFDALLFKTMATVRESRTAEYQNARAIVHRETEERVNARPVWRALAMVRDKGQVGRLDRQWIVDTYGADALDLMPKSVPPIYGERGADAQAVAELAGFGTADDMVRALMGIEQRRRAMREAGNQQSVRAAIVDEETDAIMADRYGDPLADGSIEREARELIHNDQQGEVIATELRALARQSRSVNDPNQAATPYEIAKRWAAEKVRQGEVRDYTSRSSIEQFRRTARQAARSAERAILAGDVDEAFRQKQRQMLNTALVVEATAAAEEIGAAVERLSKIAKRRTMANVDQDYLEQAQAMLEAVELRQRSQVSLDQQASFEGWARQREAEGHDIVVPASFAESLGTTHWSRLTVEKLLGLDDAVQQIMHLGRLKQTLLDLQDERQFNAVVADAVAAAGQLPQKPPTNLFDPSWADRFKSGVASADASLLKMETIFDWLDGGDPNGVFNRVVFRPIANAQDRENAMTADYLGRISAAFGKVPEAVAKKWADVIELPLIDRHTGMLSKMTRQQVVSMALNMGNAGNIQRLTDGYGWPEMAVRNTLNETLTEEEWTFVQEVWDIIGTLWPEISAMERRVNGVAPEKVKPVPVVTPFGTLAGGYFPAIYDSTRSYKAEERGGEAADLLDARYTRATTRASATKERSEKVKRPILLGLGTINRHLSEVIHDITHREAIMAANRFLSNERVMKAVDDSLGREARQQFRPWLKFVANSWAMERAGNEGIGKWVQKARSNATIVGMGFRLSTVMTQIAGYSNSAEYVGAKWMGEAIARTAAHPVDSFQFVMERSGEVSARMDTLDRDIRVSLEQMRGKTGSIWDAKRFMFHGIGYMDRMVSVPTWLGAYNKAIASGADEADAIYQADKAVRLSQGAGSPKDLAAIQRGTGKWGEALKLMTMFYSYFSAFYQRQRTLGRDVAQAVADRDVRMTPKLLARAWWLIALPPVLSELLAGRGPDDDEDWGWWAFRKMLFQMLGPIPLVRDVLDPAWAKLMGKPSFGYSISPMQRAGETLVNVAGDVGRLARHEDTKHATKNALEGVGYATGLVPGQIASATQFLVDVANGDQDPETVKDWYDGLTKGKLKEKK